MNIFIGMAMLMGASGDGVDTLNMFIIDPAGEGAALDEFAVEAADAALAQHDVADSAHSKVKTADGNGVQFKLPTYTCASSEFVTVEETIDKAAFRPDWFNQPLNKSGDVHTLAIAGQPRLTEFEAREALNDAILAAVREYVDDQIGRVDAGRRVNITLDDVDRFEIVRQQYHEDYDASVGTMDLRHAYLQFSPQFRQEMVERWKEHLVTTRLVRTALTVAGVMALLIIVFGLLKSAGPGR